MAGPNYTAPLPPADPPPELFPSAPTVRWSLQKEKNHGKTYTIKKG